MTRQIAEKKHTILVVDDDELLRQMLNDQLEQAGFSVLTASDGEKGLEQLVDNDVSLVLADLVMPEVDGIEFCKRVRANADLVSLPIILLTGRSDLGGGVNPFEVGADDYLSKPVDPIELINRIQSHIFKREAYLRLESQARDNETLLEIAKSVNSTLDMSEVLKQIVQRVASILDDVYRCSIVFIKKESKTGRVVASSDVHDFEALEIELDNYPEIRKVIETGRPVVINDVLTNPLLKSVRQHLNLEAFNAIIVLPVIFQQEIIGVMIVRALRSSAGVSEEEVRFCELVSHVSANALQHADSFRSFQVETEALKSSHSQIEHELSVKAIYELLFENASEGLAAIDSEQNILFINRRAMEITGYTREELLRMSFLSLLEPDSQDRFVASLATQKTLIARNQTFDVAVLGGDKVRRVLSVALGERPLTSDLQVLSFRDVTERREMEMQLNETRLELELVNRQLVDMDRARTDFYNTAAHEMRTPVAVVNGYCELLSMSDRDNLTDKQKDYLDQIGRSGDRLIDLIHNLLDLSRFEAGKMPIELEENDLSDLIREIGNEVRSLIDTKGLTIEVHSGPLTMIYFDTMLIRRVLMNLISNAVKFTSEGGRVSVVLEEDSQDVRVRVSDTGVGISESEQKRLFLEFSQISTSSGPESSGLGLAISKKIIEAHDGRISVRSVPGEGSHFTFSIPKSLAP